MAYTKVKPLMVTSFPSSRLTGAFGAISGANLTGIGDGIDTKSASNDPAVDTNPSDGVGHVWLNKTSGEMFICTDATVGANVWINIGGGEGDIPDNSYKFQGTSYGYTAGDENSTSNVIDKYSYTSQANATDVGDLSTPGGRQGGHKSQTHGWASGGTQNTNNIEKWAFASDGNAVDSNKNLTAATRFGAGASCETHGVSGGGAGTGSLNNTIDKFSFSDSSNATDIGNLSVQRERSAGHSSSTHGYMAGGSNFNAAPPFSNVIDKYSFTTDGNATDVGDITTGRSPDGGGASSETHGFTNGGYNGGNDVTIDKFSFASDGNATDVGDLTVSTRHPVTTSSTTHNYAAGGTSGNQIQRHAFASSGNTVDWADLTVGRLQGCGSQT